MVLNVMGRSVLGDSIPAQGALRWLAALSCAVLSATLCSSARGQAGSPSGETICRTNLQVIYEAIQAYRKVNKDLPHSLSELYPNYLANSNYLICPVARKSGRGFSAPMTTYSYEFNDGPAPGMPGRTNREWKRAEMGLLGSVVPIVRCLAHGQKHVLNLSFDGKIYESGLDWEYLFTNKVEYTNLYPQSLLARPVRVRVVQIPPRDPAATAEQVDLSAFYNASLFKSWLASEPRHNLATLPTGLRELAGIRLDLRGVIQLASSGLARLGESFPHQVLIPLNRSCHQLHFLLGTSLTAKLGTPAGRLDIQFADGQTEHVSLRLGTELGSSWPSAPAQAKPTSATLAWQARSPDGARLFTFSWLNPRPAARIRSVDCVGGTNTLDFFLVALSATP